MLVPTTILSMVFFKWEYWKNIIIRPSRQEVPYMKLKAMPGPGPKYGMRRSWMVCAPTSIPARHPTPIQGATKRCRLYGLKKHQAFWFTALITALQSTLTITKVRISVLSVRANTNISVASSMRILTIVSGRKSLQYLQFRLAWGFAQAEHNSINRRDWHIQK